uniref:40S ribosomal protein S15 n=1 Tax=Ascaris lumbricoides TaxID=6252 RepID=A0A0M3ITJ4_ASCLU
MSKHEFGTDLKTFMKLQARFVPMETGDTVPDKSCNVTLGLRKLRIFNLFKKDVRGDSVGTSDLTLS